VTGVTSAEFGTVYDVSRYDGSARTFKRARDAYDSFVGHIEGSIRAVWERRGKVLNSSTPDRKESQR
jgi:chromosome partitioning protein